MSWKRLSGAEVLEKIDEISTDDEDNESSYDSSDTELYEASLESDDLNEGEEIDDNDNHDDGESPAATVGGWQKMKPNHPQFPLHPFTTGNAGPQQATDLETELDFFKLFFTDELVSDIVDETNRYAKAKLDNRSLCPNSIWRT